MNNRENDIYKLMIVIHHWLSYTSNVSRCDLLAESSLRFPICEYLERHLGERDHCELEVPFTILSGKRRKIDIVWTEGDTLNCMELKYVSEQTSDRNEKQRIFNDLLRLYIASKSQTTQEVPSPSERHCYFVMCGDSTFFMTQFQQHAEEELTFSKDLLEQSYDETRATGDVSHWFSFKEGDIKKIEDIKYTIKRKKGKKDKKTSYYKEFKTCYIEDINQDDIRTQFKNSMPSIQTKLIGYISTKSNEVQTSQSIAIWEIMDSNNIEKSTKVMNNRTIINHLQKMNDELESLKVANNNLIQQIQNNNEEKNQIES